MKLVRYGPAGKEKPGLIDAEGVLRDLSRKVKDIDGATLAPSSLTALKKLDPKKLPAVKGKPRLGPCVATPSKFVAIGLNYLDHARETGSPIPEYPVVFYKTPSCIVGASDNIIIPRDSTQLDWEVELGVVIGRTARYVSRDAALDYVWGYTIVNDASARDFQFITSQWMAGKIFETAAPVGPYLADRQEIADPHSLGLRTIVNGKQMQNGNTKTFIFDVAALVADVSKYMTLLPGDLITTGTPPGVALGMKPEPKWLKAGDVVTLGIQGLGEQKQKVVPYKGKR